MRLKEFFDGLLVYKRQYGACEKTIREYKIWLNHLLPVIGDIGVKDLKEMDFGRIQEAGRNFGRYGPLRGSVVYRQLLMYIEKCGYRLSFDWRNNKLPKEPHANPQSLEMDELEKIRACFDLNTVLGMRTRAWFEVIRGSGLRTLEAISMNREDINWSKQPVEVHIINCKSKKPETVFLDDEAALWLRKYLSIRVDNFAPIFASLNGTRLTPGSARREMWESIKNLQPDIKRKFVRQSTRVMRKTFITGVMRESDIKTAQYLARHEDERTTLRHYAASNKKRIVEEFQRVMNGKTTESPRKTEEVLERRVFGIFTHQEIP